MKAQTHNFNFNTENRLASVMVGGQTTAFYYDAGGNRTLTVQPDGTKVYTPFPEYEKTAVSFGYDLYNSFGSDMTLAEFQGALTADVGQSLQPPSNDFQIPGLAWPQENYYSIGYFNYR